MIFATIHFTFLAASARFGYHSFVEGVRLLMQNTELAYKVDGAKRAEYRFLANI